MDVPIGRELVKSDWPDASAPLYPVRLAIAWHASDSVVDVGFEFCVPLMNTIDYSSAYEQPRSDL